MISYSKQFLWLKDIKIGDSLTWEECDKSETGVCEVLKITPTGKIRTNIGLFSDGWYDGKWLIKKND